MLQNHEGEQGRRKRILHVITQMQLGGAQKHVLALVDSLSEERYAKFLASGRGGQLLDEARHLERTTFLLIGTLTRPISPLQDLRALLSLYLVCKQQRIDLVHTHAPKAGILGRWAAWLAGVPLIVHTVHGWGVCLPPRGVVSSMLLLAERLTARITTRLISVSQEAIDAGLQHGIGHPASYVLIPHAIDPTGFERQEGEAATVKCSLAIPVDAPVVTMIACLQPQKAPLDFVEVARQLAVKWPKCRFLLVGDGELRRQVEERIASCGLAERIILTGWRQDVPRLLDASDVLVLTSRREGLPGVILEAMAAGKPVVATAVGGVPELVRDGESGFLAAPGDVRGIASKVEVLLQSADLRERMGKRGRGLFGGAYVIGRMARQVDDLYMKLARELHPR